MEMKEQILAEFRQIAGTLINSSIEKVKKEHGIIIAYTCSFVPEELIMAAGALPVRIRATGSISAGIADDYFAAANICSFVRHIFKTIVEGAYSVADGIIIGGGCDANRHIYDNLKRSPLTIPFLETIFFPHASNRFTTDCYLNELKDLKGKLENHFGREITDEKLWDAIRTCNETRRLQLELYSLGKAGNPPLTGSEVNSVMLSGSSMPKSEYNLLLQQLIQELRASEPRAASYNARLMLIGPGHDDPSMSRIIENLGGALVFDLTCYGGKMIIGQVDETTTDPLQAIAGYQVLTRPLCPKNLNAQEHINRIVLETIKEYRVDGLIAQNFLCCDMWGGAQFILNKELREVGIPMLRIEREYPMDAAGQLTTRIQAFMETISGGSI